MGGGGAQNQKLIVNQFSRHFRQFGTPFIFPFAANYELLSSGTGWLGEIKIKAYLSPAGAGVWLSLAKVSHFSCSVFLIFLYAHNNSCP